MSDDIKRDEFYWAVMKVLKDNGHSRARARGIYLEVHDAIRGLLVDKRELHIRGLLTVKVGVAMEHTYNGFTGDRTEGGRKPVVRGSATVRRRVREEISATCRIPETAHEKHGFDHPFEVNEGD